MSVLYRHNYQRKEIRKNPIQITKELQITKRNFDAVLAVRKYCHGKMTYRSPHEKKNAPAGLSPQIATKTKKRSLLPRILMVKRLSQAFIWL